MVGYPPMARPAGAHARGTPAADLAVRHAPPPNPNVNRRPQGNACRINRRHAARAVGIAATCSRLARRAGHRGPGWRRAGAGHNLAEAPI